MLHNSAKSSTFAAKFETKTVPDRVIFGKNIMSTYSTTWQCLKCGAVVHTRQKDAGFLYGYGSSQLQSGPCPAGGDHEWNELTHGTWED